LKGAPRVNECKSAKFLRRTAFDRVTAKLQDFRHFTFADKLSKAGWSRGCVSAIDSNGRRIWIADAHRGDGKRYVVHADEKLTAFLERESAIRRNLNNVPYQSVTSHRQ
jgi:hypothetical protein